MAYNTKDFRGQAANPLRIVNAGADYFESLKSRLPQMFEAAGVPAVVREDEVKSGGLFSGSRVPMLVISHPNPPSRFFDIGVVVNGQALTFPLLGESAQNTQANKRQAANESGGLMSRLFTRNADEFLLQQENMWQKDVLDVIRGLFE